MRRARLEVRRRRRRRARAASPLPAALAGELGAGPFVGRAGALERLRARFARAARASARSCCSSGEPGIGKTRLATELAREAHADGATVLYGRWDLESLVPYQPFVTAVQHYIAQRETLDAAARARARAGRARPLRPRAAPHARARADRRGR